MKKILAAIASIAVIAACSTAVFADAAVGDSSGVVDATNPETGITLTVVPVALAAGALTASGIVLKKKNK
ncbi:MAG: hypothetical protein J1E39_09155 [Eubacterium sp.]|nr:hypothetical protein [Eubacterium sp.]